MRLRIVGYNILSGGEGRADPLAEVLIAQQADIILIEQATNDEVLQRLAIRLDMVSRTIGDLPIRYAIFSRDPVDELIDFKSQSNANIFVAKWSSKLKGVSVGIGPDEPPLKVHIWAFNQIKPDGWIEPKLRIQRRADDSSSNERPGRSVSSVLVSDNVKLIDAWIETNRLAVYASDHLPVGVEIEL